MEDAEKERMRKILRYWYQMELFEPKCPHEEIKENLLQNTNKLPWKSPSAASARGKDYNSRYEIYFGKIRANALFDYVMSCSNLHKEEQFEENRAKSPTCICALKVNHEGKYIENSFTFSTFAWAAGLIISDKAGPAQLDGSKKLSGQLFKGQGDMNGRIMSQFENKALTSEMLEEIFSMACDAVKLKPELFEQKEENNNKNFEKIVWSYRKGDTDSFTELMHSFYLKDIEAIYDEPTDTVAQYVLAMDKETPKNRINIDENTDKMQKWLDAEAFPKGVWPSRNSPSLMQQLSINLAISNEQAVFSVNGPPGTGKTTLLKEIVASNVVERAIKMLEFEKPDSAFTEEKLNVPFTYTSSFYKLDSSLSGYGILVASNNNAAVENISVELPKAINKDRTGHFASAKDGKQEIYFTDVAKALIKDNAGKDNAWGLISARLGKKDNIDKLKKCLFEKGKENQNTLKSNFVSKDRLDWETAKKNFKEALRNVENAREEIGNAQNLLQQEKDAKSALIKAQEDFQAREEAVKQAENKLQVLGEVIENKQKELAAHENNEKMLRQGIPLLKRFFCPLFPGDPVIKKWKSEKSEADNLTGQLCQSRIEQCELESKRVQLMKEYQEAKANTVTRENELGQIESKITEAKEKFEDNWADDAFWDSIKSDDKGEKVKAHSCCPWTNENYNKLREELFFQALALHKSFILTSENLKANLLLLNDLWNGKLEKYRSDIYSHLFNTLQLVIPVISTTFASVERFLRGIDGNTKDKIGLLIIDEAGQATPCSALGALWRTNKAVVVGDPMQVEPIVTVPREICNYLAEKNGVPNAYRFQDEILSVQRLADQMNKYGGCRGEKWVGSPLVLHRRCIDPMFSVSNKIAYDNKMFLKTGDPPEGLAFLIESSVWVHCEGNEKGNKDHTVKEQIEYVCEEMKQAISKNGKLPNLYIITPFKTVENSLKKKLRETFNWLPNMNKDDIDKWLNENCGTIHTFQGKEANEVMLVLGCDRTSGKRAADWVGKKPNIINVAVSRAKYRIEVIGDAKLWNGIDYVKTLLTSLPIEDPINNSKIEPDKAKILTR